MTEIKNRENGLYAEFNAGYNPFVRILIPVTHCERGFFKNWPHVIYTIQAFLREAPTKGQEGRAKGLNWLAREVAAQRSDHTRAD